MTPLNKKNSKANIDTYLPTYKYVKFSNREWLCNVLKTIESNYFQKYFKEAFRYRDRTHNTQRIRSCSNSRNIFSELHNISYEKQKSHFKMRDFNRK